MARHHLGWLLYESGPEVADHTVLLLPGALCTAAFYDELIAEPSLRRASVRFAATTLPGFGGTEPLDDLSGRELRQGRRQTRRRSCL
jgi:pimeloyl-ACP methyl ester carboxylesterase